MVDEDLQQNNEHIENKVLAGKSYQQNQNSSAPLPIDLHIELAGEMKVTFNLESVLITSENQNEGIVEIRNSSKFNYHALKRQVFMFFKNRGYSSVYTEISTLEFENNLKQRYCVDIKRILNNYNLIISKNPNSKMFYFEQKEPYFSVLSFDSFREKDPSAHQLTACCAFHMNGWSQVNLYRGPSLRV